MIRLFYQYWHLNFTDLTDLSSTDLMIHKIKLTSKTKPHSILQRRWSFHMKWWLRKLIQNDMKNDIYEKTDLRNERLSSWNARAILIDKIENPIPENESRMTYDYSKIMEELPKIHMKFISNCHDYLSDLKHECFMTVDLKHVYFTIEIHSNDRKFFAFIILELR